MLIGGPYQQSRRVLIGILSGAILLSLCLLAYWFSSRTPDKEAVVETTPVPGVEDDAPTSQRVVTSDSIRTSSGSETVLKNENTQEEDAMNAEDNSGKTPLHFAVRNKAHETAEVLRRYGGRE